MKVNGMSSSRLSTEQNSLSTSVCSFVAVRKKRKATLSSQKANSVTHPFLVDLASYEVAPSSNPPKIIH